VLLQPAGAGNKRLGCILPRRRLLRDNWSVGLLKPGANQVSLSLPLAPVFHTRSGGKIEYNFSPDHEGFDVQSVID